GRVREILALRHVEARHPCLFPRRPTARVTFLSGKVTKAIGAGMTVEPTSGWLASPALLAGRAPARTRTSLCSNSRAFPARPAAMLGVMRRRRAHFVTAIHGLLPELVRNSRHENGGLHSYRPIHM